MNRLMRIVMCCILFPAMTANAQTNPQNRQSIEACQREHFLSPSAMATCIANQLDASMKSAKDEGYKAGVDAGEVKGKTEGTVDCGPLGTDMWTTKRGGYEGTLIGMPDNCSVKSDTQKEFTAIWLEQSNGRGGNWRIDDDADNYLRVDAEVMYVKILVIDGQRIKLQSQFFYGPSDKREWKTVETLARNASGCFVSTNVSQDFQICK